MSRIIGPWETREEVFARIREKAHTSEGASWLVTFCKAFDLRSPEFSAMVEEISSWISSPNEHFRQEVMFSLCLFRPVPRYEWVAIEGWKRAPTTDLHWYAGGIESSFTAAAQLTPEIVLTIAARLDRPTPTPDSYDESYFGFFKEALGDRESEVEDTTRALSHVAGLVGIDQPPWTSLWHRTVAASGLRSPGDAKTALDALITARREHHGKTAENIQELDVVTQHWREVATEIVNALKKWASEVSPD